MRCRRCGRLLTNPTSIRRGYGPACWRKIIGSTFRYGTGRPPRTRYYPRIRTKQRIRVLEPPTERTKIDDIKDFLGSIGRGLLEGAVVYGVSAAVPPTGAFLIPGYNAYQYSRVGYRLYRLYKKLSQEKTSDWEIKEGIKKLVDPTGEVISSPIADKIANEMITSAKNIALISRIAKQTRVDEDVYATMLSGSLSNGMSSGVGNFTSYAVGTFLGV